MADEETTTQENAPEPEAPEVEPEEVETPLTLAALAEEQGMTEEEFAKTASDLGGWRKKLTHEAMDQATEVETPESELEPETEYEELAPGAEKLLNSWFVKEFGTTPDQLRHAMGIATVQSEELKQQSIEAVESVLDDADAPPEEILKIMDDQGWLTDNKTGFPFTPTALKRNAERAVKIHRADNFDAIVDAKVKEALEAAVGEGEEVVSLTPKRESIKPIIVDPEEIEDEEKRYEATCERIERNANA